MPRKLKKFMILFDNPDLLYFPGHVLSGRVVVDLDDHTPVLGVYFQVMGEGVVSVAERHQHLVEDKEDYLDFRLCLFGDPVPLSPGIHSFPFELTLPSDLPSTFLGKHGYVQYFCKAMLREPNGLTHKNQEVFILMNPIDLNLEPPVLSQPFNCEITHPLGRTCISQGSVICRLELNRGGYVPGETIYISASIRNHSRYNMKKSRACLTETIQYVSRNKVVQNEIRELSSMSRGRIKPGDVDEWKSEPLGIPPLPPTNLRGCHLIRIQYDVYFIIEPPSWETEIKMQLPIMIATYPYRDSDGTLKAKGVNYPQNLPTLRSWLNGKSFE